MDQSTVVTEQIEDGQKLIDHLVASGVGIDAAFWAWPVEEAQWYLYLATPLVDQQGAIEGYRQVHNALDGLGNSSITTFHIKLLDTEDSITRDILRMITPRVSNGPFTIPVPYRHRGMTSIGRTTIGGLEIDGAMIYPPPVPVAAK
jgi:hypothetical protein